MNKVWIISDSHFNHSAIKNKFEFRPDDFEEQICRKIKNNLDKGDTLIHLGDVIFNRPSELGSYLSAMGDCTKILVRGNHDKSSTNFYYNNGFSLVVDEMRMGNIIFSHIPKSNLEDGYYNIHGHLHTNSHHISEYTDNPEKYILYCAEKYNYMPILLNNIIKGTSANTKI